MGIQAQQQRKSSPLGGVGDHEKSSSISDILYQALIRPPPSMMQQNSIMASPIPSLPPNQNLNFPFRSLSCFGTNSSSITSTFQISNVCNDYIGEEEAEVEPELENKAKIKDGSTMVSLMPSTSSTITQPWQMPVDTTNYWNWDDINTYVSSDLNIPWDDSEIKP